MRCKFYYAGAVTKCAIFRAVTFNFRTFFVLLVDDLLDFLDHLLVVGLQQLEEVTDVGRVVGGHCPEKKKKKRLQESIFLMNFLRKVIFRKILMNRIKRNSAENLFTPEKVTKKARWRQSYEFRIYNYNGSVVS
jgi:hypothetical protein